MTPTDMFNANLGHFDVDPGVIHHFSDGLYAKQMHLPKGYMAGMHAHNYSHLSILGKGKVIVRTDNDEKTYTAPVCINMQAEILHSIEALEDAVWFCIHATEETDVNKVDEVLIHKGV
jgi:quercetin dioxygenase-like cupin family protein